MLLTLPMAMRRQESPVKIDFAVNGTVRFSQLHSNSRPGLLLLNGIIYMAFSYNWDVPPYHGWVISYSYGAGGFKHVAHFCTTPGGLRGGIWQGGKGVASDGQFIYVAAGNGDFDPSKSQYAMSVLKLTLQLELVDYYTPHDWHALSNSDLDTGSAGPLLVNGTSWLFIGPTKAGRGYILDTKNMGKWVSATQDTAHQALQMSTSNHVAQQPIVWAGPDGQTYIYVWTAGEPVYQYKFDKTTGTVGDPIKSTFSDTTGGGLTISSNGAENGILWAITFGAGPVGNIYALDATDVSKPPLFKDYGGSDAHFGWVTVANGKVYSPASGKLRVYGIK